VCSVAIPDESVFLGTQCERPEENLKPDMGTTKSDDPIAIS